MPLSSVFCHLSKQAHKQPADEAACDIIRELPPDKIRSYYRHAEKCRPDLLQEHRPPELKKLQSTCYQKYPQCNLRRVLPSRPEEERHQAPEYFIRRACQVKINHLRPGPSYHQSERPNGVMMHNANRIHLRRRKYEIMTSRLITSLLHVLGQLSISVATGLSIHRNYRNEGGACTWKISGAAVPTGLFQKGTKYSPKSGRKKQYVGIYRVIVCT